jgi:hypothetical protein
MVIMPFMEQQAIYDSVMAASPASGTVNALGQINALANTLDGLVCPSDGNGKFARNNAIPTSYRGCRADLSVPTAGTSTTVDFRNPRSWLRVGPTWADGNKVVGGQKY